jgi:ABC-type glycerol-3-phosphate transport system permease component
MQLGIAILVMRAFFRSIPSELEDAAVLDGASTLQMLRFVMLPLVRQGVIVVALFTFVAVWNEYLLAAILLPSQDLFTLPAGIAALFTGKYANNWPAISAGVVFSAVPALIIFLLAQDRLVEGWTKGR